MSHSGQLVLFSLCFTYATGLVDLIAWDGSEPLGLTGAAMHQPSASLSPCKMMIRALG